MIAGHFFLASGLVSALASALASSAAASAAGLLLAATAEAFGPILGRLVLGVGINAAGLVATRAGLVDRAARVRHELDGLGGNAAGDDVQLDARTPSSLTWPRILGSRLVSRIRPALMSVSAFTSPPLANADASWDVAEIDGPELGPEGGVPSATAKRKYGI